MAAINEAAPIRRRLLSNGWQWDDDRRNPKFASFDLVASRHDSDDFLPPATSVAAIGANIARRGTLKGWKRIAGVAQYSTAMMVALCIPFAAPLLSLTDRPSFGIVFYGPSRAGKTSAQLLASSVVGFGSEEHLPTLDATHAGLLAAAFAFNDHMLPINEVATARVSKADMAEAVRGATYALMSGRDVMRHPSWPGHQTGGASSFKVIPVLSSERSPDEWASRRGETREAGETARLIGLPVVMRGAETIFDFLPYDVAMEDFPEWQRQQFKAMRAGLPHQRGVAFYEFIMLLVRNLERYATTTDRLVDDFEKKMLKPSMSLIERDIVAKFGVLNAGGRLAATWGILPFDSDEVGAAVERACVWAIAALPDPKARVKASLSKLKKLLDGASIVDLGRASAKQMENIHCADGYVESNGTERTFTVRFKELAAALGDDAALREVIFLIDDEGFLVHRRSRTAGRSLEWATAQPTWPNGTRARSIIIKLPRGLSELDLMLG